MKPEKILVSVVVPIYKVEAYLEKCIQSILDQTYQNLEIILVDDGSPDNCGKICDDYQKKDKRIKVIHKKNGGLSDARNKGLKVAKGEYICFIDSDDYISKKYVEVLLTACIKNNADISVCDFWYVDENGKQWCRKEKQEYVYTSYDAIVDIFTEEQNTEVVAWNKLYKRSLFIKNKIEYPYGKTNEDNFTTYRLYDKANKIVFLSEKLYYYLQRNDSIMGRAFNKSRLDSLLAVEEINEYFKQRREFQEIICCNELLINFSMLNNMILSKYNKDEINKLEDSILQNKSKYLQNNYISNKQKMMLKILNINRFLYEKLYLLLKKI